MISIIKVNNYMKDHQNKMNTLNAQKLQTTMILKEIIK